MRGTARQLIELLEDHPELRRDFRVREDGNTQEWIVKDVMPDGRLLLEHITIREYRWIGVDSPTIWETISRWELQFVVSTDEGDIEYGTPETAWFPTLTRQNGRRSALAAANDTPHPDGKVQVRERQFDLAPEGWWELTDEQWVTA